MNLQVPARLLCGPGPANAPEAVLHAMGQPLIGHMDPWMGDLRLNLLHNHALEIGGGLGPDGASKLRIGLMGVNASNQVVERIMSAIDQELSCS